MRIEYSLKLPNSAHKQATPWNGAHETLLSLHSFFPFYNIGTPGV